jgi:uncharacterized membrane protein YphA (DoxX/SURF4 family)
MKVNEILALLFLILLRIAIGWHFLFEGVEKQRSVWHEQTETNRPWTSEAYFREGTGPVASMVRAQIGDTDDLALARLTVKDIPMGEAQANYPAYKRMPVGLDQEWNAYFQQFADFYQLDAGQRAAAEKRLQDFKDETVTWFITRPRSIEWYLSGLWTDFDRKPFKHTYPSGVVEVDISISDRVTEYRNKVAQYRGNSEGQTISRFGKDVEKTEKGRRTELRGEIVTLRAELNAALDSRSKQMHKALEEVLTEEQRAKGKLPEPAPQKPKLIALIDSATIWGLIAIGACMMLGLFSRTASFFGAMFLVMTLLTAPALPWLPGPPVAEGSYVFVNKNVIELFALLLLTCVPTGRWFGVDALISALRRRKKETS